MTQKTELLSEEQAKKMRLNEYSFPKNSGSFKGKLKFRRKLQGKPCLMCYFQTDNGAKIVLPVWEDDKTKKYIPKEGGFCFLDEVSNNSDWLCEYIVTKTNHTRLMKATMLSTVDNRTAYAIKFFLMLIKKAFPRQLVANISVTKFSLSDKILFSGTDGQIEYLVEAHGGDYILTRNKTGENKEKDVCILIDGKSFDIISKTYK